MQEILYEALNKLTATQCALRIIGTKMKYLNNNNWINCCLSWKFRSYMVSRIPIVCKKDEAIIKPIFETMLNPLNSMEFFTGKQINCSGYEDHSIECTKLWSLLITIVISSMIIVSLFIVYCIIITLCCISLLCCKKLKKTTVINITASSPPIRIISKMKNNNEDQITTNNNNMKFTSSTEFQSQNNDQHKSNTIITSFNQIAKNLMERKFYNNLFNSMKKKIYGLNNAV